jgi:hypothetical protein
LAFCAVRVFSAHLAANDKQALLEEIKQQLEKHGEFTIPSLHILSKTDRNLWSIASSRHRGDVSSGAAEEEEEEEARAAKEGGGGGEGAGGLVDEEGQEEDEEGGDGEGFPPGLGEEDKKEAAKPSSTEATPEGRLVSIHTPFLARAIMYVYTSILYPFLWLSTATCVSLYGPGSFGLAGGNHHGCCCLSFEPKWAIFTQTGVFFLFITRPKLPVDCQAMLCSSRSGGVLSQSDPLAHVHYRINTDEGGAKAGGAAQVAPTSTPAQDEGKWYEGKRRVRGWGCVSTSVITCPHVHVSMIGLDVSVGVRSLTLVLDLCGLAGGQEGPAQLELEVEEGAEGEGESCG